MKSVTPQRLKGVLPQTRDLYYGGKWQVPQGGYGETINPGTGESLGKCADANAEEPPTRKSYD